MSEYETKALAPQRGSAAIQNPSPPEWRSLSDWSRVSRPRPSIVEYTDVAAACNEYPQRIVSPSHPSACCGSGMASVGMPERDGHWVFQYQRCRTCGFTVRRLLRTDPDKAALANLRKILARSFSRWNGEPG